MSQSGENAKAGSGDTFKAFSNVLLPDPRQEHFAVLDFATGQHRQKTLRDHHDNIAVYQLNKTVPLSIRVHFDTARNLLLYAWFAYRFIQVAELHALATTEMALRMRLPSQTATVRPRTLRQLLRDAAAGGLLRSAGFHHWRRLRGKQRRSLATAGLADDPGRDKTREDELQITDQVIAFLADWRNSLAHGSDMLMPHGHLIMAISCDTINQLFDQ